MTPIPLGVLGSSHTAPAAGGFAPDDLPDLNIWLAADAISGLSDGDVVSTWPDSSPAARNATQVINSYRPTYQTGEVNGLPVVRFDGVNDHMFSAAPVGAAEQTLFAVLRLASQPAALALRYGSPASGGGLAVAFTNGKPYIFKEGGSSINTGSAETALGTAAFRLVTLAVSSSADTWSVRLDATPDTNGTTTQNLSGTATTVIGASGSLGFHLNADLAELVVYSAALTSGDRDSVETYLTQKYGI